MGNHPSHPKYYGGAEEKPESEIPKTESEVPVESLLERLDFIATNYILTMDFKNLKKMHNKEYCNELVLITTDIFNKYLSDLEIQHLSQRIDGQQKRAEHPEQVLYFYKSDLKHIDSTDSEKRLAICKQLALFYVKIAHLFAAIVTTINPEYVYTSKSGKITKRTLMQKQKIPKGAKLKVKKTNICGNRIRILKHLDLGSKNESSGFCYFNLNSQGKIRTLEEEPGIPELLHLYYDDNFDYETGKFLSMSDSSKQQFLHDLQLFYKEFTGEQEMPPEIRKFSDIKLRNYGKNMKICQPDKMRGGELNKTGVEPTVVEVGVEPVGTEATTKVGVEPVKTEAPTGVSTQLEIPNKVVPPIYSPNAEEQENAHSSLLKEYANNLKQMIQSAKEKQQQLLEIINQVFLFVKYEDSDKKYIRIHPKLTNNKLQQLIEETRGLIVELYLQCETDFTQGIHLYEAIIESQMFQTTKRQISNLQESAEKIIHGEIGTMETKEGKLLKEDQPNQEDLLPLLAPVSAPIPAAPENSSKDIPIKMPIF